MPDYHVFIRVEAQKQAGKGAAPGDVVSIRPAAARITDTEKKRLLILKVSMTDQAAAQLRKEIRPRAHFKYNVAPPADPAAIDAYMLDMAAERQKLRQYGKHVELTTAVFTQKQLDEMNDLEKACEPIPKDKSVIGQATAVIL